MSLTKEQFRFESDHWPGRGGNLCREKELYNIQITRAFYEDDTLPLLRRSLRKTCIDGPVGSEHGRIGKTNSLKIYFLLASPEFKSKEKSGRLSRFQKISSRVIFN